MVVVVVMVDLCFGWIMIPEFDCCILWIMTKKKSRVNIIINKRWIWKHIKMLKSNRRKKLTNKCQNMNGL